MSALRKVWSQQEDSILKEIILEKKIVKWSLVAKVMEQEYNIPGRTGKQCRQRWHNQLDPTIKSQKWTDNQENLLYKFHNVYGNKWAKISIHIPGRTDNCVKNHFYSNLRKALRRINLLISNKKLNVQGKLIRHNILQKIVALAEERFERRTPQHIAPEELIEKCVDIKNRVVRYSKLNEVQEDQVNDLESLVKDINELTLLFRHFKPTKLVKQVQSTPQNVNRMPSFQLKIQCGKHSNSTATTPGFSTPGDSEQMLSDGEDSINLPIIMESSRAGIMELESPTLPNRRLQNQTNLMFASQEPQMGLDFDQVSDLHQRDDILRLLTPEDTSPAQDQQFYRDFCV